MDILMLSNVGYWYDICKEKLSRSLLLIQNNITTYLAIQNASSLPTFRTNLTIPKFQKKENRVYIPISDDEATLSFYAIYHQSNQHIYHVLENHLQDVPWENYTRTNEQ